MKAPTVQQDHPPQPPAGPVPGPEELAALAERQRPSLARLGAAVTGDLETGHDLAQDAIEALLQAPDVRHPEAWLRRVVVNKGRTWCRRQGLHRAYLSRWESWRLSDPRQADDPDVADQLAVRQALARLSPDHRAVLVLRYYDDLEITEIARTLDLPTGTVKSRLNRALRRLKGVIDDD